MKEFWNIMKEERIPSAKKWVNTIDFSSHAFPPSCLMIEAKFITFSCHSTCMWRKYANCEWWRERDAKRDKIFKLYSNWSMKSSTDCGKL